MSVEYKDYYKLLGVSRNASEADIRSAYRKLARKYHPDINPGGAEQFKELNEAYEALKDPEKRKLYDNLGANWRQGQRFNPPPGYGGGSGEGFGDMGGFSSFFDTLFGGSAGAGFSGNQINIEDLLGGRAPGGRSQGRGASYTQQRQQSSSPEQLNIEQALILDLKEVYTGVQKEVMTPSKKRITVTVPKGVRPGQKIRLTGEGKAGRSGRGDLLLVVQYRYHPGFSFENDTLTYEALIPVPVLALGGKIAVKTVLGQDLDMTVPEGTSPGSLMRLKGQGLPGKDGKSSGDLLVRLKGELPKVLSDRERALYEELKALQSW